MAAANLNEMLGELMNSPLFWMLIIFIAFFAIGYNLGWFNKFKPIKRFKPEDLNESLLKDIKPRLKIQGKKVKDTKLMQKYTNYGKVRRYSTSIVKFEDRKEKKIVNKNKASETTEFEKVEAKMIYFLVGGNPWLSWIPYIGKNYAPDYFVINQDYVKYEPQSRIFDIQPDIHVYPYARIWISGKQTQTYMTELQARRTQEFEAETNINTLKRWTYYNEVHAGRVGIMEKDTDLEQQKWDNTREVAD